MTKYYYFYKSPKCRKRKRYVSGSPYFIVPVCQRLCAILLAQADVSSWICGGFSVKSNLDVMMHGSQRVESRLGSSCRTCWNVVDEKIQ